MPGGPKHDGWRREGVAVTGRREWLRVSPAADGLVAMTVLPAGVAVAVMRRRARRRDGLLAWRYRTHGGVAADRQREHDRSWADLPGAEHHRAHQQPHRPL